MSSDPISAEVVSDRSVRVMGREDPITDLDTDADPQTVFYLKPVCIDGQQGGASSDSARYLQEILHFWATKIEATVREKLKTSPSEHGTAQASWNRASFRSKLLDNLMKNTPWMAMRDNATEDTGRIPLTGKCNHDKRAFGDIVTSTLQTERFPVNNECLAIIPNYISEAMTLAMGTLQKIQRFAILLPVAGDDEMSQASMRIVIIGFELGNSEVKTTKMAYEAVLNERLFERQKLDESTQKVGKAGVQRMTVDYAA